jgi:serine protease Do
LQKWFQSAVATLDKPWPRGLEDIVARVKPAVFGIRAKVVDEQASADDQDQGFLPRFGETPDEGGALGHARSTTSQGSGFFISSDGYAVTTNHVIEHGTSITIETDDGNTYPARVVASDPQSDIALLKVDGGPGFRFVEIADQAPRIGEWVIAVGNPFELGGTVTAGIVSAQGRDIGSGPYDYMQIDAAVNRGNSGGPTFNLDGEVVGVNTAIYSPSGGNVGIAFAIPARTAMEVVEQLKSTGSVSRGWLGVKIQNVDQDVAASLGLVDAKGALVTEVTTASPAADAGLKNGDAILAVNGQNIDDSRDLARKIAALNPDSKVDIKILRGQKEQTVPVKLGKFPSGKEVAKVEPSKEPQTTEMDQLGLTIAPASGTNKEGVVVTEVDGSSDAAQKGIKSGDIILEVGGLAVKSPDDVANGVKEASKLGRKAVLMRIGRRPALCRRAAEERLIGQVRHACRCPRRSLHQRMGRLVRYFPGGLRVAARYKLG